MDLIVVDDENIIRTGISSLIRKCAPAWNVICEASSAEEVLKFAEQNTADLILLDIKMPEITGIDLMQRLKDVMPDIIFVVISGYSNFNYAQQALRLGAFDYLTKPVHVDKLLDLLNRVEKELATKDSIKSALNTLQKEFPERKLSFLRNIVFGTVKYSPLEIDQLLQTYNLLHSKYRICSIIYTQNFSSSNFFDIFCRALDDLPVCIYQLSYSIIFSSFLIVSEKNYIYDISDVYSHLLPLCPNLSRSQVLLSEAVSTLLDLNKMYYENLLPLKDSIILPKKDFPTETGLPPNLQNKEEYPPLVQETIKNIQKNYFNNISLTSLAKMIFIHPIYLSELFKKETGMNISNYITLYRMEKAKEMLENIENKIYDVAYLTGYDDSRYFSQVFKKYTGMTPTQYREKIYLHPSMRN